MTSAVVRAGRRRYRAAVSLCLALAPPVALSGCAAVRPLATSIESVVWLRDGTVFYSESLPDQPGRLWRYGPTDGKRTEVKLSLECGGGTPLLSAYPDGRLGVATTCVDADPPGTWLYAVSPDTGAASQVGWTPYTSVTDATWTSHDEVYLAYRDSRCASIVPLRGGEPDYFDAPLTFRGSTWRTDEYFHIGDGCRSDGLRFPMRLPGTADVLVAVRPADPESANTACCVATLTDDRALTVLADGFDDIRGLAAAPDGRWAVVAGVRSGRPGLWRVPVAAGPPVLVAEGGYVRPAVSPGGTEVAVVDRSRGRDELRIVKLPG